MANKPESALDAITSLGSTFVRMISSGGESVKATIANVAKYIIETYASSSLAGSNQSVKAAIDSLNSKINSPATIANNIDTVNITGFYKYGSGASGTKPTSGGGVLIVISFNATYTQQIAIPYAENGNNNIYKRVIYNNTPTIWQSIMG